MCFGLFRRHTVFNIFVIREGLGLLSCVTKLGNYGNLTIKNNFILKAPHIAESPTLPVEQTSDKGHRSDLEIFSDEANLSDSGGSNSISLHRISKRRCLSFALGTIAPSLR